MASPANPLDKFVTYTPHFELHAASAWDDISGEEGSANESSTTRFSSNGTLLINTRKDAHQTIDNVKIEALAPLTSKSDVPAAISDIKFDVKEPGSFAFMEKLVSHMNTYNVKNMDSLVFGLKVLFVGRDADNNIDIIVEKMIPMVLYDMNASFDEHGGIYNLSFIQNSTMGSPRLGAVGPQMDYSYTNKTIAFEAPTLEAGLGKVQEKLNEVYKLNYDKYNDDKGLRKINYKVTFDGEVKGKVVGAQANTFAPDEPRKFVFDPKKPVTSSIMDMIMRCPDFCEKIGAAKDATTARFNAGAFVPLIIPSVKYNAGSIDVTYHVKVYKGGPGSVGPFEFDYYFADAGKNVDVLAYDVKFNNLAQWLSTKTKTGVDRHTNQSATVTDPKFAQDILHENVTQEKLKHVPAEKSPAEGKSGDIAKLAGSPTRNSAGYNSTPYEKTPSIRLASDSIAHWAGAINFTPSFEIRGHKDLLTASITPPGEYTGLLGGEGIFIKVNVFMPDGEGGKKQFFYTGYYRVLTITNIFSAGKFTQHIVMLANEKK